MFSDPTTLVVGASGGVYCLFGAHFGHTCLNFHELHRGIFNRWTRFGLLGAFVAIDSYLAYQDLRENKNDASTSYSAHIGGFIAGIGFSSLCFHELVEHSFVEEAVRFGSALVVVVLAVYLAINAAVMDPIKGIHTPVRSEVYCCYQTAYCSGFSKSDNDFFVLLGRRRHVGPTRRSAATAAPPDTPSCTPVDWAAGDSAPTAN
ncbi:serine-type endopeptidase [Aureococcus anophagefferens]|nr:serine-type endopeptidase [Aureococcus anophagefferens]